ncbi:hypothetical protein HMPREF0549_0564, partial [Limosilactobacillus vaginalis DSM 5837 = ATCC 49540]
RVPGNVPLRRESRVPRSELDAEGSKDALVCDVAAEMAAIGKAQIGAGGEVQVHIRQGCVPGYGRACNRERR